MPPVGMYHEAGMVLLNVDSYEASVPSGRFFHPYTGTVSSYQSLTQFLLKLDQILNLENVPQSFHAVRTFFPPYRIYDEQGETLMPQRGKLATFSLHIRFRRNASWQGTVLWLEQNESRQFRSVLELISLLDSVLSGTLRPAAEKPAIEMAE